MTELRQRMIECLQLRGLSGRTQEAYVRAVRQLSEHLSQVTFKQGKLPVLLLR